MNKVVFPPESKIIYIQIDINIKEKNLCFIYRMGENYIMFTITEGKFPKKPEYGKVVIACRKDFKNFKEDRENRITLLLDERIEQFAQIGFNPKIINNQKDNLESIKNLIKEGKEDTAFSLFFRTFPTCLPHRSQL